MDLQTLLRGLIIEHGVQKVNMAWVGVLTDLEAQIKAALHPEPKPKTEAKPDPKPEPPKALLVNTIEGLKVTPTQPDLDKKKIHKEAVAKRHALLLSQGITPSKLLTEESLRRWINDGKSYWLIAEEIGVPDTEISAFAKKHGIQSRVSKIIASKK